MENVLVVLVGVALMTVVGHALWLLTAGWLRVVLGARRPAREAPAGAKECPRCGRCVGPDQRCCARCGLALDGPTAAVLADLEATSRQLRRFVASGILDRATVETLQGHISLHRDRLRCEPAARQAAAPVAVPPNAAPPAPANVRTAIAVPPAAAVRTDTEERPPPRRPVDAVIPAAARKTATSRPPAPAHQAEARPTPTPPAADLPRTPPRSVTEALAVLMDERNILWGELAGGLLIVGCSIALVISLWRRLEQIPYFPFLIFAGITAGVFGAGLYSWHRWQLRLTGRGLLAIATLLVPLNFLVMAGLHTPDNSAWVELVMDGSFLAAFGALIGLAGRVLAPAEGRQLSIGIVGCSAAQLAVPWLLTSGHSEVFIAPLSLLIAACQQVALGRPLGREPDRRQAAERCAPLGIVMFAAAVAIGFLVYWSANRYWAGDLGLALERVAPAVALVGLPVLTTGLTVHRGVGRDSSGGVLRTVGTAVALGGAVVMLAAVALAWPQPRAVVLVCALDFAALSCVAFRHRLPVAHAGALPCLALGYLTVVHLFWATPETAALGPSLRSADSGAALVGLFCVLLVAGEAMRRAGRRLDAVMHHGFAGCVALASLVLVTWLPRGTDEPARAMLLYGAYGVASLGLAQRWHRPVLISLGLALTVAATLWELYWQQGTPRQIPVWGSVLAAEGLGLALVTVILRARRTRVAREQPQQRQMFSWNATEPLARSSEGIAMLAILAAVWAGVSLGSWPFAHVFTGCSLLGLYLLLTAMERRAGFPLLAGVVLAGTAAAVGGWLGEALASSLHVEGARFTGLLAVSMATAAASMAAVAAWLDGLASAGSASANPTADPGARPWHTVLPFAWRQTAAGSAVVALALSLGALQPDAAHLTSAALALLAATTFALAWGWRSAGLTWLGSAIALGAVATGLFWHFPDQFSPAARVAVALLAQASLTLCAALALRRVLGEAQRVLTKPLGQATLVSSGLALGAVLVGRWGDLVSPAVCLCWLASVWLVLSCVQGRPRLFGASQAVLCLAVLFGATALLETRAWFLSYPANRVDRFYDPRSLQAYGAGLALLSLLWMTARLVLGSGSRARSLMEPGWPAVDRVTLAALVLIQPILAAAAVWPAVVAESAIPAPALAGAPWPPHVLASCFGPGAWLLLALTAGVLVLGLWDRWGTIVLVGLVILALTVPVLASGWFAGARATGPALRWGLAHCFLGCSAALWLRSALSRVAHAVRWRIGPVAPAVSRRVLVAGGTVPVVMLTAALAAVVVAGGQPVPPLADSWFGRVNWIVSLAAPLVILGAALLGHGLRERSPGYVFSAGLVLNAAVTGSYPLASLHSVPAVQLCAQVVQLGTAMAAAWATCWLAGRAWFRRRGSGPESPRAPAVLRLQIGLCLSGNAVLIGSALALVAAFSPARLWIGEVGSLAGWIAFLGAAAALALALRHRGLLIYPNTAGVLGLAALGLAACSSERWWPGWGYRALMCGWAAWPLGWVLVSAAAGRPRRVHQACPWLIGAGIAALALAVRATWADPRLACWAAGSSLAVSVLAACLAIRDRQPIYAYASGALVNVAGWMAWVAWTPQALHHLAFIQVLCTAVASASWSALAIWTRKRAIDLYGRWLPLHQVSALAGLWLLGVLVLLAVAWSLSGGAVWAAGTLAWAAVAAIAAAVTLCLADRRAGFVAGAAYALGLMALGLGLHTSALRPREFIWSGTVALSLYALLAAVVGLGGRRLRAAGLPGVRPAEGSGRWFVPAQGAVAFLILVASVWVSMTFESVPRRLAGALSTGMLVAAGVVMAHTDHYPKRVRFATLAMGVAAATELGWALLDPSGGTGGWLWLHRTVFLMAALAVVSLFSGVVLGGRAFRERAWVECGRRSGPVFGLLATVTLAGVLLQEAWLYHLQRMVTAVSDDMVSPTPMAPFAIALVLVALLALLAAGLCFAVLPGTDPFGLSERGRTTYVYAAEVLLVLAFVHLRLTVPALFHPGVSAAHWPFIVMALAFAGSGLSEWCNRRGLAVLAEPLERTGVCLPLLPVLAFWVLPPGRYALVWFLAGLLYGCVAVAKQSFRFALLAALAANGGLWVLLHHHRLLFLNHPQGWLIPPAVIVLVSEHLNRDRLTKAQSAVLRYVGLIVIYLSSTADMFVAGVGTSWQWPLVLAALSVLGILLGMLLRVRAFLYLGSTFLVLVVATIIWHAGVDERRTWILWASGIGLGTAILALFGAFEKHRNELLRLVDDLRGWD